MRTDNLDYELPQELIAQTPNEPRDSARLLIDLGPGDEPADAVVRDLASHLKAGDLLVVNETRVLPARVPITREGGGAGEVLLLEPLDDGSDSWQALCRPSRKLKPGEIVTSQRGGLDFKMGGSLDGGLRVVTPLPEGDLLAALDEAGVAPLPPYITTRLEDEERYQTVFSRRPASAAAPTAGLHLSPAVFDDLAKAGVEVARLELVVGIDTFRPITTDLVEEHEIHSEFYRVPAETWEMVQRTRSAGGRVVAVGTTSVRALESAAAFGELDGRTRLFITPGFEFQVVDVLMTNFHLPRSSLLAMIEGFIGPRWRALYATALERRYRFLSFGDAMLLSRSSLAPDVQQGDFYLSESRPSESQPDESQPDESRPSESQPDESSIEGVGK
ncbi:MAG TPA: tRNA preQ1(34) S-adenosylmethionine ribosyltransferase-isomerase QueA [Microthrixaceae bacterium]|nr:tRNA preQ1(34) S-adenosylmethionine ribosyltransferase-isomerase QueA [Microthrixaceae bacterium]